LSKILFEEPKSAQAVENFPALLKLEGSLFYSQHIYSDLF